MGVFTTGDKVDYIGSRKDLAGRKGVVSQPDKSGRIAVQFRGVKHLSFVREESLTFTPPASVWQRICASLFGDK